MQLNISDAEYRPLQHFKQVEDFFLAYLRDRRDFPFIILMAKVLFFVVPFATVLLLSPEFSWWLAAVYWGVYLFFLGPVTLMLHNTSHRILFKNAYSWANYIIPWLIVPFFGQSPETYYAHHVGMHHIEENLENDLSSTMEYQRDSVLGFLHYAGDFLLLGFSRLVFYLVKRKRGKLFQRILLGELSFYTLLVLLSSFNFKGTLVVFIVPFLATRFLMMTGNWAQHAFIDASDPSNPFKSSITTINTSYNRRCFNDGYHIGHHLNGGLHWSLMPGDFLKKLDQYRDNQAIVFQGIDYFEIWFLLMIKKYDVLAARMVSLGGPEMSQSEKIALLQRRTAAILPKRNVETELSSVAL